MHRGLETRVQADMGIPWGESTDLHQLRQVRPGLPDRAPCSRRAGRWRQAPRHKRPFLPWMRVHTEERGL